MPSSLDFDAACYLARYPDLRDSRGHDWRSDPYAHYTKYGRAEGRAPGCDLPGTVYSPVFNGVAYLNRYPDVKQSDTWRNNPLGHYQRSGIKEGRIPGLEIITPSSPLGFSTPGTTVLQADAPVNENKEPGDGQIIPTETENDGTAADTNLPVQPGSGGDFMQWIRENQMEAIGIAAGIVLLIHLSKNKNKR